MQIKFKQSFLLSFEVVVKHTHTENDRMERIVFHSQQTKGRLNVHIFGHLADLIQWFDQWRIKFRFVPVDRFACQ